MKRLTNIVYYIKMFLFIVHFYFVFLMLHSILDTKIFGYLFLFFYFIYVVKIILELLSKKQRYKCDIIYNLMQIGFSFYVMFIATKINIDDLYVTVNTYTYFKTNYIIASMLIVFALIYSLVELHDSKKKYGN